MRLLLDTDTVIEVLRGNPRASAARAALPAETSIAVSSITAAELYFGAARSADPATATRQVAAFLSGLQVIAVGEMIAARFGALKASLRAAGQIIPDFDLLIAATALVHDRTLVTHNTRHFARVPSLTLVDWLS